jgi:hypothetical protein
VVDGEEFVPQEIEEALELRFTTHEQFPTNSKSRRPTEEPVVVNDRLREDQRYGAEEE